ncbi:MAG: preprotein translocase subunit SecE [Candidatus Fermentibacteria bacterium]|nr:preprotein translocase subunit SecE [Candidatus Fermentibacteria bacterium]
MPKGRKMAAKAVKASKSDNPVVRLWKTVTVFFGEVKAEMIKVAWPTRDEAISSTWVVLGAVVVVGIWIFVVDKITAMIMAGLVRLLG